MGLALDIGPGLGPQGLFGDQIDRAGKQVFQVELNAEVTFKQHRAMYYQRLGAIREDGGCARMETGRPGSPSFRQA
jgi:hypothetical protein